MALPSCEADIRFNLAKAYQLLARFSMDDLTYTHLSARIPESDTYLIYPLGFLFQEVTPECLLKVNLEGEVLEGHEAAYNRTGYVIHSSVYRHRPDINAVFHLHTASGVAVSAMACGLLPISQFSFHFYNRISSHPYDALALNPHRHGENLARDLGQNKAMLLQNHGTLTCGATIQEAFFYTIYLERACRVQCMALQSGQPLITPSPEICEQAAQDMRAFEPDLGQRDWAALMRTLAA